MLKEFLSNVKIIWRQEGFSLLEMIVAIAVFLVAFLIILGALVSVNDAARKTESARTATDNLSAAIDLMSRNVRVGNNFHCGCGAAGSPSTPGDNTFPSGARDCAMSDSLGGGGDVCLAFEGQQGDSSNPNDQIVYKLSEGSIARSIDSGASYIPLTAPELRISNLRFYVYGTKSGDDQPVVTMVVRGSASTTERTRTTFDLQTTVSAYTPNLMFTP